MAFHFPLMPRICAWRCAGRTAIPIVEIMQQTPAIPDDCQWAIFLRNHDELTLEMVTDEERDYMYREYAADPRVRINLGIRRRLAPLVGQQPAPARAAERAAVLAARHAGHLLRRRDRHGRQHLPRRPQRRADADAVDRRPQRRLLARRPARSTRRSIIDPVYGYQAVNVEAQRAQPGSLLNWMKRLIRVRKQYPAFGRGTLEFLHPENRRVLAYMREHEDDDPVRRQPVAVRPVRGARPVGLRGAVPVELIGRVHFPPIGELPYLLTLGPHDFYWFELTDGDG